MKWVKSCLAQDPRLNELAKSKGGYSIHVRTAFCRAGIELRDQFVFQKSSSSRRFKIFLSLQSFFPCLKFFKIYHFEWQERLY